MWTDDSLLRTSEDKIILVSATPLERGGVNWIKNYPIFNVGIGKIRLWKLELFTII
jgi:hypothetical protein